jgi:hypothetical protein
MTETELSWFSSELVRVRSWIPSIKPGSATANGAKRTSRAATVSFTATGAGRPISLWNSALTFPSFVTPSNSSPGTRVEEGETSI